MLYSILLNSSVGALGENDAQSLVTIYQNTLDSIFYP